MKHYRKDFYDYIERETGVKLSDEKHAYIKLKLLNYIGAVTAEYQIKANKAEQELKKYKKHIRHVKHLLEKYDK